MRGFFLGRNRRRNLILFVGTMMLLIGTAYFLSTQWSTGKQESERAIESPTSVAPQPVVESYQLVRDVAKGARLERADVQPIRLPVQPVSSALTLAELEGKYLKLALPSGAVLIPELLAEQAPPADDVRLCEFMQIELPAALQTGDAVDVRLKLADGQDLVVLAQKKVLQKDAQFITLALAEAEILRISAAETDVALRQAKLYALRYVDPLLQAPASVTYRMKERPGEANSPSQSLPEN
jgi:hypothetical protein